MVSKFYVIRSSCLSIRYYTSNLGEHQMFARINLSLLRGLLMHRYFEEVFEAGTLQAELRNEKVPDLHPGLRNCRPRSGISANSLLTIYSDALGEAVRPMARVVLLVNSAFVAWWPRGWSPFEGPRRQSLQERTFRSRAPGRD